MILMHMKGCNNIYLCWSCLYFNSKQHFVFLLLVIEIANIEVALNLPAVCHFDGQGDKNSVMIYVYLASILIF